MSSYFKIDLLQRDKEEQLVASGKHVRNYGRLNRWYMDELAKLPLESEDPKKLLEKKRPWRMQRFLRVLASRKETTYGTTTYRNYKLRVMNGGIEDVLGKGKSSDQLEELLSPWANSEQWWSEFEFYKSIIGTSLINMVPDRAFAIFIFAKDAVGDDSPIYYLELEVDGNTDRHTMVIEMDQVLTARRPGARPHEAAKAAEYASGYQKVYFYINWDERQPRRIIRAVVSDLPKAEKSTWDTWMDEQHIAQPLDAWVSIILTIAGTLIAVLLDEPRITLIAGIVVAGIASEEWIPPQAIILGAVARMFANESVAMRMYYRANLPLSVKRVTITLLSSVAEISRLVEDTANIQPSVLLGVAAFINCAALLQTGFAGVYGSFSHSDFPPRPSYFPKIYVEQAGYFRQVVNDCRPVEEFCSVFRPLLHWQRGVKNRFLGDEVDLAAPGSPPSFMCYFLMTPASSKIAHSWLVYGQFFPLHLILLALVEQFMLLIGAVLLIFVDFPVTFFLACSWVLKRSRLFPRRVIRSINSGVLYLFQIVQLYVDFVDSYNAIIAAHVGMDILECRGRSTARLYRIPLMQRVRTGRSSNHSWKFGDYLYDNGYYRVSDILVVNPRAQKLGMVEARKLFFNRHKLLWTTIGGIRYENPCLACGDNSVSRRTSIEGEALKKNQSQKIIIPEEADNENYEDQHSDLGEYWSDEEEDDKKRK